MPLTLSSRPPSPSPTVSRRWRLRVEGAVQGVGFRPWCLHQAVELGLSGWVRNDAHGLDCEIQGPSSALEAFARQLRQSPPPLAAIRRLRVDDCPPIDVETGFTIRHSGSAGSPRTLLPPDTAPCEACLDELFDPADRRWRHPFINCTHCGPRFTLTRALPYDRAATALRDFALCADCAAEYADPADRRHHAQATCCPRCGPSVALWSPDGQRRDVADVIAAAVAVIEGGGILAVKGVGGYQLLCDARQSAAVHRLRDRKRRASRPFGLLVPNVASARQWVRVPAPVDTLLTAPDRSILLLPCLPGVAEAHPALAPGLVDWGLALPASPLHWLLVHQALGRPLDSGWREAAQPLLWVMTSANPGGEPLVIDEADAVARLGGLADALLVHDRPIVGRADDSVRRPLLPSTGLAGRAGPAEAPRGVAAGQSGSPLPLEAPFVRRARGWVPVPIDLPGVATDAAPVLATGGWLKNTICVTRGNEAFVSPHIGDLSTAAACRALVEMVERLTAFLAVRPVAVAHDLHPDFFSTRQALALANRWQIPALGVQHHRAHAAAVMAEHGLDAGLAIVLDGVGLGTDGQAWGGELLRLDGTDWERLSHLPPLPMAGGQRVAHEPWRLGAAVLAGIGRGDAIVDRFAHQPLARGVAGLLREPGRLPTTTSAGRLFDAAAALLGLCDRNDYEGEAAMRLEACAAGVKADQPSPGPGGAIDDDGDPDLSDLYRALAAFDPEEPAARAAMADRFHRSLASLLVAWVGHHHDLAIRQTGQDLAIVLAGGCWINQRLRELTVQGLARHGRRVHEARAVPCGDGGLSLGQAALALRAIDADPGACKAVTTRLTPVAAPSPIRKPTPVHALSSTREPSLIPVPTSPAASTRHTPED